MFDLQFKYSPPDVDALIASVEQWGEQLIDILYDAVREATELGEERMVEIIATAFTPTGFARAERGGHPGRIETGDMLQDVESEVNASNDSIEGEWGWLRHFQDYYRRQEVGDGPMEPMSALQGSYIEAREMFIQRLLSAGRRVN